MQRFKLIRYEDVSGSSGTGIVAEGVVFSDGKAVMRWLVPPRATSHFDSIEDVTTIHGHEGRTVVEVIDRAAPLLQ